MRGRHYLLHIAINGVQLPALYDSGAASTCISRGLAETAGLRIAPGYTGGVKGIEGQGTALAGAVVAPQIRLHEDFNVEASHILVLQLKSPLLLLGNDLFGNNTNFSFLGLKSNRKRPILEVYNKDTDTVVEIVCERGTERFLLILYVIVL